MKRFKDILNEGNDSYPADDMTISELKIACYAAQNILDRIEDGAMVQRWQISAIVKAKEELASVYTSMSADEGDDDEWEDEAHEYHYQMNTEEVELDEGYNDPEYIRRAIPALKNAVEFHKDTMEIHDKKSVKGSPEYVRAHKDAAEKHKIAHAQLSNGTKDVEYYVKPARELGAYAEKLSDKANALKEEVEQIDEISKKLAKSYLDKSAAEREANPQYATREKFRGRMIGGATADAKLKGRVEQPYKFGQAPKRKMHVKVAATNEEVDLDEAESWESGYDRRVVKTTKPEHKEKGYNWRIKGKERPDISIKLFKDKPSQAEFNKEMKRVAGHEFGG